MMLDVNLIFGVILMSLAVVGSTLVIIFLIIIDLVNINYEFRLSSNSHLLYNKFYK